MSAWRAPVTYAAVPLSLLVVASACQRPIRSTLFASPTPAMMTEFWVEPSAPRELLYGVGGLALAPDPHAVYTVMDVKAGGFSDGYTVRDPDAREWKVKLYPEARTEVVASRILWALGYRQPPAYTLNAWTADGARSGNPQPVGRFREEKPDFHGLTEAGHWSYFENPFVGTRPMAGLLVLHAMLGNSDLKDAQNVVYTLAEPVDGASRWYVARDLGQTFGRTGIMGATRDDIEAFETTPFITGVEDGHVRFDYRGRFPELFANLTPDDVHWICERLNRLTDRQWTDAFRAGGYEAPTANRYIYRLKQKIAQGLAVRG